MNSWLMHAPFNSISKRYYEVQPEIGGERASHLYSSEVVKVSMWDQKLRNEWEYEMVQNLLCMYLKFNI